MCSAKREQQDSSYKNLTKWRQHYRKRTIITIFSSGN